MTDEEYRRLTAYLDRDPQDLTDQELEEFEELLLKEVAELKEQSQRV